MSYRSATRGQERPIHDSNRSHTCPATVDDITSDRMTESILKSLRPDSESTSGPSRVKRERSYDEVSGYTASQEVKAGCYKRQCSADPAPAHASGGQGLAISPRSVRGHFFAGIAIGGQSRVQLGDQNAEQITNNHIYQSCAAAVQLPLSYKPDTSEADVQLTLFRLLVALVDTPVTVLLLFQCAIQRAMLLLPKQMCNYSIYFEDAFGNRKSFEI